MISGLGICLVAGSLLLLKVCYDRLSEARALMQDQQTELPVVGDVAPFTLTNSMGRAFGTRELEGRVWVADLVFTTCATLCPTLMTAMAGLQETLPRTEVLNFVSISVNPSYDTPEVMAEFGYKYGADTNRWHLLTGPMSTISDISVNSLKIGNRENPIDHSAYMVLIDPAMQIRGYYDAMDPPALERLKQDVTSLLEVPRD